MNMKKQILAIIYIAIGIISMTYAIHYTLEDFTINSNISSDYLLFTIPSFVLTGFTFYFGIKFLTFKKIKPKTIKD